jgi:glycerol-3-phosphate dehydrogenase
VTPLDDAQREVTTELARNAKANGVEAALAEDGSLAVPGESITDPAEFTRALAAAAQRHGAELRTRFRVERVDVGDGRLDLAGADGSAISCRLAVNCAGLRADEVARMAGDDSFEIYPRKGEFLVLEPPADARLDRILLPTPTKRTKGVLVFPSIDGRVVAGPTAVDQLDKDDWSVRDEATEEILPKARAMWPPLEGAEHVASYAGLRPAGRGVNYLIGRSEACPVLVNVAAIRSTGLTASLGIAEHVCEIIAAMGIALGPEQPPARGPAPSSDTPWWRQAADRWAA